MKTKSSNMIIQYDTPDSEGNIYKKGCFGDSLEKEKQDFEIEHPFAIPHSVNMKFIKND